MSYILDALRKSEQERQRGKVPDINTLPNTYEDSQPSKNIWPIVTAAIVIVNLLILGYFIFKPSPVAVSSSLTSSVPIDAKAAEPIQELPEAKPVSAPAMEAIPEPDQAQAPSEQPVTQDTSPNVLYLPYLEELPQSDQSNIPDMTFSSHMYSSMPKYRSIIINGKRLKEGQFFNADLQVREITENGAVLSQRGVIFQVDVLGRWSQ